MSDSDVKDLSDLEILRMIIKQGAKGISKWRVGPKETMDALSMYYKMTQGSAFADMISALAAAGMDEVPETGEEEAIEEAKTNAQRADLLSG